MSTVLNSSTFDVRRTEAGAADERPRLVRERTDS
jgi:hypothetical protein